MEEPPHLFLCPISMELMQEPVTVSTGVTYDRRSIERWLFSYGRATCPATMQPLANLDLTPNHTLARVISSWLDRGSPSSSSSSSSSPSTSSLSSPVHELGTPLTRMLEEERLRSALGDLEETPFKVTALKSMRSCMAGDVAMQIIFVASGGVEAVGRVMAQALAESGAGGDFSAFTVCEEAAAVLAALPLSDEASVGLVLAPECLRPVMALLQRGSAEARLHAMGILTKISSAGAGGHWTSGSECAEGRLAFAEHGLSVAAVARTMLRVSDLATQLAVKVLWLVSMVAQSEKVLEDMVLTGAVAKLLGLLHVESAPSTKQKTVRMVRIHGVFWRQYPCFPTDLKDYLRLLD
uniref:U-box domain-containing protein n=1 Tax=Aegilops tauschii TaxID=37682 RepID=M8CBP5_AEGTA